MAERVAFRSSGARTLAAALGTLLVAEIAVLALSPGQPGPAALSVDAADYIAPDRLARAEGYRADTRLVFVAALVFEFAALTALALGRPRRLWRRIVGLQERHPLGASALAGAGVSLVLASVALPVGLLALDLRVDAGLSTQTIGGWLFDRLRAAAIGVSIAALAALLLVWLQRRLPRRWWVAGAGVVVAYAAVLSFLAPLVLAPIFNDFEKLPAGPSRSDALELARLADVEIGDVYRIDASSRGTTLNAYVDGFGASRRVVVYDNLLDGAEREALRWVIAHELGHVAQRDIPRGLLFVALVALPGMLLVREAGAILAARAGSRPGSAAAVPAYALAVSLTALGLGLVGNQLSRAVEERADRFALEITADPDAMIALQSLVAERNLSDVDPPRLWQALFGSHPSKLERLGLAEAYRGG